ncbi:MAG: hypothetical protein GC165_19645 [Armatimonadetes bacterium]|nr:hypothetical protein [Armatimonadota bacterium]
MDKIDNQREKAIEALGDKSYEMRWSKSLAFGWACGYLYLFWIVLMPLGVFIKFPSPGLAMATSFVGAGVLAAFAGWRIHRRGERYRVRFDKSGFSFWLDHEPYFQLRWIDIKEVSSQRGDLIVTRTDGRIERAKFPSVERSRDSELFKNVLKTFQIKKDTAVVRKRRLWITSGVTAFGVILAIVCGRPAMLAKDYDGVIGAREWISLVPWSIDVVCVMIGFIFLSGFLFEWIAGLESKKNLMRESKFGPNLEDFLKECNRWPKPLELVPGKKYRYIDPEGIAATQREKLVACRIGSILAFCIAMLTLGVGMFGSQKQRDNPGIAIGVVLMTSLGSLPLFFVKSIKRRIDWVDDIISVDNNALLVEHHGLLLKYPKTPKKVLLDIPPAKDSHQPFMRLEKHGVKPDVYQLDRRFLMAIPDDLGLASEDVVGDGVEHVPG